MVEHIKALGIVGVFRALLECLLGAYLLATVGHWSQGSGWFLLKGRPEPGDREFLLACGIALIVLAVVRLVQSISSLLARGWSRRLGLFLAVFDIVLPLTLPLALWSLVVYRHPETRGHFREASLRRDAGA